MYVPICVVKNLILKRNYDALVCFNLVVDDGKFPRKWKFNCEMKKSDCPKRLLYALENISPAGNSLQTITRTCFCSRMWTLKANDVKQKESLCLIRDIGNFSDGNETRKRVEQVAAKKSGAHVKRKEHFAPRSDKKKGKQKIPKRRRRGPWNMSATKKVNNCVLSQCLDSFNLDNVNPQNESKCCRCFSERRR